MNQILSMIFASIIFGVGLVAFFALLKIFFPLRIEKSLMMIEENAKRSFWIGLVNLIFLGLLAVALFALGNWVNFQAIGLLGVIILVVLAIGAIFGLGAVVQFLGLRLVDEKPELVRTAWGTLSLGFASALPFVGWFLLFPFVVILGLGAFILSLFYRPETSEVETPEA